MRSSTKYRSHLIATNLSLLQRPTHNKSCLSKSSSASSTLHFSSSPQHQHQKSTSSAMLFHSTRILLQQQQQFDDEMFDDEAGDLDMMSNEEDDFIPPPSSSTTSNTNNMNRQSATPPPQQSQIDDADDDFGLPPTSSSSAGNFSNQTQQRRDETDDMVPPSTMMMQQQQETKRMNRNERQPRQNLSQPKRKRNVDDDEVTTEALDLVNSLGGGTVNSSRGNNNNDRTKTEVQQQDEEEHALPSSSSQQQQEVSTTSLFSAPPSSSSSTTTKNNINKLQQQDSEDLAREQQQQQESPTRLKHHIGKILQDHLSTVTPGPTNDQIESLLSECKDGKQLNKIIDELILPHPLMHDMLNGHGFRVFVFTKVAVAGLRLSQAAPWLRLMRYVRTRGFKLTRTYVTYCLDALRKETSQRFNSEGRNPHIAVDILSNTRYLLLMAAEDSVYCDWVLMTKTLFVITAVVAIFDRQNLYRTHWPVSGEVPRREGIVSEWVIAHDRPVDYDRVVQLADRLIDNLTQDVRERFRSRPPFSFIQRLADYYFATDNLEKMICVLEEALEVNVPIGESSAAKLMQLACAFNHPRVPELFMKFRVQLPQCMLAAPDFSRLLFWYSRSGGGRPCPQCGESFNHRNVSLSYWNSERTTHAHKKCVLLHQARVQKGELENNTRVPQCQDWSKEALALYELAQSRAIQWTSIEWRGFILCHIFCKDKDRALNSLELLQQHLDRRAWDDFLAQQVIRLLRYHDPRRIIPTIKYWQGMNLHISPLVVQEAAIGVMTLNDEEHYSSSSDSTDTTANALNDRVEGLAVLTEIARGAEIYTMAYTERVMIRLLQKHVDRGDSNDAEELGVRDFCSISPRALREEDRKDSCSDVRPATNRKSSVFTDAERFFPSSNVFDF